MGIELYNQQNAVSDDPYALVLKLYEGIIKYLSFAKSAINNGDVENKFIYINKSIEIFDVFWLLGNIWEKCDKEI